eukprot:GHVQ01022903.1.p1 GENE.GHVQ01022903.1~~GHVQ01022903.1.p1  ORF type:complete len:188 (+),score=18.57 GHVQ01022903.1:270-833(+)
MAGAGGGRGEERRGEEGCGEWFRCESSWNECILGLSCGVWSLLFTVLFGLSLQDAYINKRQPSIVQTIALLSNVCPPIAVYICFDSFRRNSVMQHGMSQDALTRALGLVKFLFFVLAVASVPPLVACIVVYLSDHYPFSEPDIREWYTNLLCLVALILWIAALICVWPTTAHRSTLLTKHSTPPTLR